MIVRVNNAKGFIVCFLVRILMEKESEKFLENLVVQDLAKKHVALLEETAYT